MTVPGTSRSYEAIMIESVRDYMVDNNIKFSDITKKKWWARLVVYIRV